MAPANTWHGCGRSRFARESDSIGYVAPGPRSKEERAADLSKHERLTTQMRKFSRLTEIAQRSPLQELAATSFVCRTFKSTCGSNRFIIGEAASQSDPITENGHRGLAACGGQQRAHRSVPTSRACAFTGEDGLQPAGGGGGWNRTSRRVIVLRR